MQEIVDINKCANKDDRNDTCVSLQTLPEWHSGSTVKWLKGYFKVKTKFIDSMICLQKTITL